MLNLAYLIHKDKVVIRHSGNEDVVKDNPGQPVAKAMTKMNGNGYHTKTSLEAVLRFWKIVTKDKIAEVLTLNFFSAAVVHHITRGKIDTLYFELIELIPQ